MGVSGIDTCLLPRYVCRVDEGGSVLLIEMD